MIRLFLYYRSTQRIGIKHAEHTTSVGYVHGGSIGILVTSDNLHSHALEFDCHLFT